MDREIYPGAFMGEKISDSTAKTNHRLRFAPSTHPFITEKEILSSPFFQKNSQLYGMIAFCIF
jgi:hypothetical protein